MSYIAALDVGTTTVRCFVLNKECEIQGLSMEAVELLNPKPGYFEIEPEKLWLQIVRVIDNSIRDAQLRPSQIACLGISTQRCTFLTWDHVNNEYFHNFITWKDLRSDQLVDEWNKSFTLRTLNAISYALYLITGSKRFLAGSVVKMMNGQVTMRLLHEIQNNLRLRIALKQNRARLELLDSWILYKLRVGRNSDNAQVEHISDITSCTATGLFDPFILDWSPLMKYLIGIDASLLPKIVSNSHKDFGYINPSSFGSEWAGSKIPISISISDQAAALFGSQCFHKGDVKITIGTGAFLDLVTGNICHASVKGMYPLVVLQVEKETTFCVESAAHDMGTVIAWGQRCGLFSDPAETSSIAQSVNDSDGVYFVPAFSGLGAPINDYQATSGFIGITPSTQRAHLIRALLESIAFRLVQIIETAEEETQEKLRKLRVDGGVSRNDFICQILADASGIQVERSQHTESSVMGAAYAAGLKFGMWKDISEFRKIDKLFKPQPENLSKIRQTMNMWLRAVERFSNWY